MDTGAAALGQRLLDETNEEGLGELLHELRAQVPCAANNEDHQSRLGADDLDELLEVFSNRKVHPDIFTSPNLSAPRPIDRLPRKQKAPVLEISSPNSGGGKSQLIYYLAVLCVLPSKFKGRKIGGRDGAAVLLDTDGRLDIRRLYQIAQGVVWHNIRANMKEDQKLIAEEAMSEGDMRSLLNDALQHIHVFRPQTSSSLLATIKSLDKYLFDVTRHHSAGRPLHAVFLDSASAFYWQDRLRDEVARTEEIGRSAADIANDRDQRKAFHMNFLYRDLVVELRRIQFIFDCSLIFTTWGLFRASPDRNAPYAHVWTGPPSFRPHLPPPWGKFANLRLLVQRDAVRPYPATSGWTDLERDAPIRQAVVRQGKFSAWVDTWSSEDWPPGLISALRNMPENGGFPFWVREDGVFMDDLMSDVS